MNKFCPIWPRYFGILFSFSAEHRRPRHCFSDVDLRLCLVRWSLVLFFYASHLAAPVTLGQSCLILRLLIRLQFCFSLHVSTCPRLARNPASGGTGRLLMTRAFMRHGRSFGAKCPLSGHDTNEFERLFFKVDEIRKTEIVLKTISWIKRAKTTPWCDVRSTLAVALHLGSGDFRN